VPDLSQQGKPMTVTTPLGPDALVIERLECTEAVSSPYEIILDLLSENASIETADLLRKPVVVSVDLDAYSGEQRIFHGMVRRITQLGRAGGITAYRAELVPSLWFLSLATDCRIFQQKSVPDIVKDVLTQAGVTDVKNLLTGSYPVRDYCVQYRESHLAFISRLMEEEGIFYFFEHTKGAHTMVLADGSSAVKPGQAASLEVRGALAGAEIGDDVITEITVDTEVRSSGEVTLADYNELTAKRVQGAVKGNNTANASKLKQYDYPGKFNAKPDGERLARVRIEEAEALSLVIDARTTSRAVCSGHKLDIKNHYRDDINKSYHVLSVRHEATEGSYRAGGRDVPFSYEATFRAMPHDVPFRPQRVTPKSIVHGSQTAMVVGKSGEEIYVDKYGRVKVQFYWDHLGTNDEKSSCWVRVSSTWAGKQWGFIQIPRVGQEVIVDFLEGDPDRPVIVGRVYNGEQMPPYALPDNMTQSGVKTRSSKGGAAADANEIRFEDKKDAEILLIHAQKDHTLEIENDDTQSVGNNRTITVEKDETTTIKGSRTETVEFDEKITINGKRTESVALDEALTYDANQTVKLSKGKQTISVKGDRTITVETGNLATEVKTGNHDTKVDVGNVTMKAQAGAITYESIKEIEFKCGPSSVKLGPDGVTIKGLNIKVEGTISTEVKGVMTTVKADGIMTVKGAMTMIN
jgi:type VI secretion system Vgr family protein